MADAKLTALTPVTTAGANSLLYMVIDPSGTPLSRGITTSNLFFSRTLGSYGVTGLIGANNAATSTTQFDVSANIAVLRNPTDTPILIFSNTGTLTNNVLTAGPAANGRDQAGAFQPSSWIHLYLISKVDGSGLATLSSTVAPPTGPTLPSTYTHWAYIGAVRFDSAPRIVQTYFNGNIALYDEQLTLLSAGTALVFTAVDGSSLIPPNTRTGLFSFVMVGTDIASTVCQLLLRVTGSLGAGQVIQAAAVQVASGQTQAWTSTMFPVNSAQSIDYKITDATDFSAYIFAAGYTMPNGG